MKEIQQFIVMQFCIFTLDAWEAESSISVFPDYLKV